VALAKTLGSIPLTQRWIDQVIPVVQHAVTHPMMALPLLAGLTVVALGLVRVLASNEG